MFNMKTAHSMRVVGAPSLGTMSSSTTGILECPRGVSGVAGRGGGSANSVQILMR